MIEVHLDSLSIDGNSISISGHPILAVLDVCNIARTVYQALSREDPTLAEVLRRSLIELFTLAGNRALDEVPRNVAVVVDFEEAVQS